jgi:hypothetical protein
MIITRRLNVWDRFIGFERDDLGPRPLSTEGRKLEVANAILSRYDPSCCIRPGFLARAPRDGKVRSFLRNDQVQAYYTVALIAALGSGILNVVLGLMAMIGS